MSVRIAMVTALYMLQLTVSTSAEFVSAPYRIDVAFDELRSILYISNGGELVRYDVAAQEVLVPVSIGGELQGLDISSDGSTLAIADAAESDTLRMFHLLDLSSLEYETVTFERASTLESGTFSVAYGNDDSLLLTTDLNGSGWVPLRRYVPTTMELETVIQLVRQRSMLAASADRAIIGILAWQISDGRYGRYKVSDGTLTQKTSAEGTGTNNLEIGVNRDGTQFAIASPTGCHIINENLEIVDVIGSISEDHPISAAYHPIRNVVYFPWDSSESVRGFDARTFTEIEEYSIPHTFDRSIWAFDEGRLKISSDGSLLFVTIDEGVWIIRKDDLQILEDPVSQTQVAGGPVTFSVMASGTATIAYQWQVDDDVIPGATSADLVIAAVDESDAGVYRCSVATATRGPYLTTGATLDVLDPFNLLEVWVQFGASGLQLGSEEYPVGSIALAVQKVANGGDVRILAGSSAETISVSKPMTFIADNGTVRIGD